MAGQHVFPFSFTITKTKPGCYSHIGHSLNLPVPIRTKRKNEVKFLLNVYFHVSLWCLKRFYKGLKLIFISLSLSEMYGTGRIKIGIKDTSSKFGKGHIN